MILDILIPGYRSTRIQSGKVEREKWNRVDGIGQEKENYHDPTPYTLHPFLCTTH